MDAPCSLRCVVLAFQLNKGEAKYVLTRTFRFTLLSLCTDPGYLPASYLHTYYQRSRVYTGISRNWCGNRSGSWCGISACPVGAEL